MGRGANLAGIVAKGSGVFVTENPEPFDFAEDSPSA
jgi:hypothetical protein